MDTYLLKIVLVICYFFPFFHFIFISNLTRRRVGTWKIAVESCMLGYTETERLALRMDEWGGELTS